MDLVGHDQVWTRQGALRPDPNLVARSRWTRRGLGDALGEGVRRGTHDDNGSARGPCRPGGVVNGVRGHGEGHLGTCIIDNDLDAGIGIDSGIDIDIDNDLDAGVGPWGMVECAGELTVGVIAHEPDNGHGG
jgi:hypothetical protein